MGKKSREKKARQKTKFQENKGISSASQNAKGLNVNNVEKHLNRSELQYSFIRILLIFVVCFIAYSGTFNSSFHLDDENFITSNPAIKDLNYFLDLERLKDLPNKIMYGSVKNRYLGYLSFALNYKINGLDVRGYHIVNVVIHCINSVLVYLFILLLFNTLPLKESVLSQHKKFFALSTALIFTIHPIQTQAVTYIAQRFASLATLFYLASVIMYVWVRIASTEVTASKKVQKLNYKTMMPYGGALLCTICAMKTKEIAFTLPFTLLMIEWMFFQDSVRKRVLWLMPFLSSLLIIPASMLNLDQSIGNIISTASEATRLASPLSRFDYFFTQLRVIVTYVRLLILPVNQNVDYDYPVLNSIADPNVLLSGFFIVSIIILAIITLYRYGASKPIVKLTSFGVFWFFITLSVESSFIPINDIIFEHRLYLPSVGFFLTISTCIYMLFLQLKKRWQKTEIILLVSFTAIAMVLTFATYERNKVWQDDISLWQDVVKKSPNNARGHNNLGNAYLTENLPNKALPHFETALKLSSDYGQLANYNLGVIYHQKGLIDAAIKKYQMALQLKTVVTTSPYIYANIHNNLALAYQFKKLHHKAIEHFNSAIKIHTNDAYMHNDLGLSYMQVGLIENARKHFQTALRILPNYKEAQINLRKVQRK